MDADNIDQETHDFEQLRALFANKSHIPKPTPRPKVPRPGDDQSYSTPRAAPPTLRPKPNNLSPRSGAHGNPAAVHKSNVFEGQMVRQVVRQFNSHHNVLTGSFMDPARLPQDRVDSSDESDSSGSGGADGEAIPTNHKSSNEELQRELHSSIMEEMRSKGIIRKESLVQPVLPPDVGKLRAHSSKLVRAAQNMCRSEPNPQYPRLGKVAEAEFCDNFDRRRTENFLSVPLTVRTGSMQSSPSTSTISDDFDLDVFEYDVPDAKEARRLRDLHGLVHEFYKMEKSYVDLLRNFAIYFPTYIDGYVRRTNRQVLTTINGSGPHVVEKISKHLSLILNVHQILLKEFGEKFEKWDSRRPEFASVLLTMADYLKICSEFLKEKQLLCEELNKCIEENRDFAHVVKIFEDEVMNAPSTSSGNRTTSPTLSAYTPGIPLVMHLDAVHQNVVRYNLLMERYYKLLPDESDEKTLAEAVLRKLKTVSETVNVRLADADSHKKLISLHRKLQGAFNVFAPGRQLLWEGKLMKQSRRELQERHLIAAICRYCIGSDYFDPDRIYRLPIGSVRVHVEDHEDYDRQFSIINPRKSHTFFCKSVSERDTWVKHISNAVNEWKRNRQNREKKDFRTILNECLETDKKEDNGLCKCFLHLTNHSVDDALWIPDNKATKCLMEGCETKFNLIFRRHHCRNCGWLICRRCTGYAPVKTKKFESVKVCPECFDNLWNDYCKLRLFPFNTVQLVELSTTNQSMSRSGVTMHNTLGSVWENESQTTERHNSPIEELKKRIASDPWDDDIRIMLECGRLCRPRDLFRPPFNRHFRRVQAPLSSMAPSNVLVSGKVFLKSRKDQEVLRWARLDENYTLNFYSAEFDTEPTDSHLIYGFSLNVVDPPNELAGSSFILEHHNQIQTDSKAIKVEFRIENRKTAQKWQCILEEKLQNAV